jgi:predicted permease
MTVGVLVARAYGTGGTAENPLVALLKVPPLWAVAAAVALNVAGVPLTPGVEGFLSSLGATVPPLMLIALGMALVWDRAFTARLALLVPAVAIQLLLVPALVWPLASGLGLSGEVLTAVVLEGAMPCMVLGMVFCDRFGLDSALYAGAVTVSTVLSLVTLPLWFAWVG